MAQKPKRTTATLCIVESLEFLQEDTHREGEIISRTLRLSGKPTHYVYLRSRDELEAFVKEFGRSDDRYLHISCHGNTGEFFTTTGKISAVEFAKLLAPHVSKRRVFLSACLVSVRRLLDSFESLGFDGAHLDSRRGLHCGRTRTGRSTTAIT
jgi:hypothetical protein